MSWEEMNRQIIDALIQGQTHTTLNSRDFKLFLSMHPYTAMSSIWAKNGILYQCEGATLEIRLNKIEKNTENERRSNALKKLENLCDS